jgi:transposase
MAMVCGLDLHRGQITFDALELDTGDAWRGRVWSPDRERFRRWLSDELAPRARGDRVDISVEGCTGWRYVVEEITAAGFVAHLAEPAETQTRRGRKKRAKTDRSDARLQRELLARGELPESWIPPTAVLEWRERARLYKSLLDQRTQWVQRIHAELFQHGIPSPEAQIRTAATRAVVTAPDLEISPAGRQRIEVAYRMIDAVEVEQLPLRRELVRFGKRQPACAALVDNHYGISGLTAVIVWSELGDCQRFRRSMQVVRHAGLDLTVDQSDLHRTGGKRSRQGPQTLRWALYEAAKASSRQTAPDHDYYAKVKAVHNGKVAALSIARKLARRCFHTLRALDPDTVYAMP